MKPPSHNVIFGWIAVLLLLLVAVASGDDDLRTYCSNRGATCNCPFGNYCFSWSVDSQNITVEVMVQAEGYFGWGISNSTSMYPGWVVLGYADSATGEIVLRDRNTYDHKTPDYNSIQMTMLMNGSFVDGVITAVFTRVLYTPVLGYVSVDANAPQNVIWAVNTDSSATPTGPADSDIPHHTDRGVIALNWDGTAITIGAQAQQVWHGILMGSSFGLLMLGSIFVARFMKAKLGHNWYRLHVGLNMLAFCGTVAGFVLITVYQRTQEQEPFFSAPDTYMLVHHILGLVVVAVTVIQPCVGAVANSRFDPERTRVPVIDKLHWWFGRLALVGGITNVFLGIHAIQGPSFWFIVVGVWVGAWAVVYLVWECRFGKTTHLKGGIANKKEYVEINSQK